MKIPFLSWFRERSPEPKKIDFEAPQQPEKASVIILPIIEPSVDFPLFPWDRKRPRARVPQSNHTLQWQGKTYGLRAQNGLLFLRAFNDEKTWIVATPLSKNQEIDVEKFPTIAQAALGRSDIARFVMAEDGYLERNVALFFRNDNTGFCRESWNRDDFPFEHGVTKQDWEQSADETLAKHIDYIGQDFLWNAMAEVYGHEYRELDWICGSREELEKLACWICWAEPALWIEGYTLKISIHSENEFTRASVAGLDWDNGTLNRGESHLSPWFTFQRHELTDEWSVYRSDSLLLPVLTVRWSQLFDIALDENTPVGLEWEYRDYGSGRCANSPYPKEIEFELPFPSHEQQLEARVSLREWLKGKVASAEIEAIMSNDEILELPKLG